MTQNSSDMLLTLAIESPNSTNTALNHRLDAWPPPEEMPITIDSQGNVVSRYRDPVWRLDPWTEKPTCLNFGLKGSRPSRISPENAELLKLLTAWWIWGPCAARNALTLRARFSTLRPLFAMCSENGVLASELDRFPLVIDLIGHSATPSRAADLLTLLHQIHDRRETLGFAILDKSGLKRLASSLPSHEERQTPYIPPRIWKYQVLRLRECIEDYLIHKRKIEQCYKFCLDAYAKNYGSLELALTQDADSCVAPFGQPPSASNAERTYFGAFVKTAERFGIAELLEKWVGREGTARKMDVTTLTSYLLLVSRAGLAYILNFSLMRISEALSLRTDCLIIENDSVYGKLYLLKGQTTKTKNDSDDRWPTSPLVQSAVEAMTSIANLRILCNSAGSDKCSGEHPYLIQRCAEPWIGQPRNLIHLQVTRQTYMVELGRFSKFFDMEELRITPDDLKLARLVTPTLSQEKYAVGKIWPLAYHQLRRTGAVNMQASGLVSESSLQYLLKHATRAMTLYYGRGHGNLKLNEATRQLYVKTMYETIAREFETLLEERFVSPHGDKRKAEMLNPISLKDIKRLDTLAKTGKIGCRSILLGYCMNREPCPFGGVDSIAHCGGGDTGRACPDILYDRAKIHLVAKLETVVNDRLAMANEGPLAESLKAQQAAIRNYKNAFV